VRAFTPPRGSAASGKNLIQSDSLAARLRHASRRRERQRLTDTAWQRGSGAFLIFLDRLEADFGDLDLDRRLADLIDTGERAISIYERVLA
jgi:hypothetical protein